MALSFTVTSFSRSICLKKQSCSLCLSNFRRLLSTQIIAPTIPFSSPDPDNFQKLPGSGIPFGSAHKLWHAKVDVMIWCHREEVFPLLFYWSLNFIGRNFYSTVKSHYYLYVTFAKESSFRSKFCNMNRYTRSIWCLLFLVERGSKPITKDKGRSSACRNPLLSQFLAYQHSKQWGYLFFFPQSKSAKRDVGSKVKQYLSFKFFSFPWFLKSPWLLWITLWKFPSQCFLTGKCENIYKSI